MATGNNVSIRSSQLVDPVLTNIARQYRPEGFVANLVAPRVAVVKESGKYPVFDRREFSATDVDLLKSDRARTKEVDFRVGTEGYLCEEYAVAATISRRERDNADEALRLEANKANLAQDQLALAREIRVAAFLTVAGGGIDSANTSTPSNNWNVDAATIEDDIRVAIEQVFDATGRGPNTILIPYKVANAIAIQQDIREILKYTVNGQQILDSGASILPARLWGLQVLIPTALKATSAEGATDAFSQVWGDDPRVLTIDANASYGRPSTAHQFVARETEVRRWQENNPMLDYIETSEVVDEVGTAPTSGAIIVDVLS